MPSSTNRLVPVLNAVQKQYLKDMQTPWKIRVFFFRHLPSMWWWGGRIVSASPEKIEASLPFSWRTQNPFSSTYFAAQSGVGELVTGLLVQLATKGQTRKLSTLVIDFQGQFTKKATETVFYSCEQGAEIFETVQKALQTNEAQTIDCTAVGTTAAGLEVGRVKVTWSIKAKST